jgi:hypothetical protein
MPCLQCQAGEIEQTGGTKMPKDATKNIDRYKIRGGQINEFEYTENQKALAGKKSKGGAQLIPGTPPEEAGEGVQPTVKAAAKDIKSTTKKAAKKANTASPKGATAKKLAARKAAAKK